MSVKASFCALLGSLLVAGTCWCQTSPSAPTTAPSYLPTNTPGYTTTEPPASAGEPSAGEQTAITQPPDWITYPQCGCCGPVGGNGPITWETYLRAGPSMPVGGTRMSKAADTGWEIQGGGRSLFFEPSLASAWVIDLSLANIHNKGEHWLIPFNVLGNISEVLSINRTFVTVGGGKEFFFTPPSWCNCADRGCNKGWNWRWGVDGGGQLGTASVRMQDLGETSLFARTNDVYWGVYSAIHADAELPVGCCTYMAGLRVVWDFDWMSSLGSSDYMQDINVLFTFGVRF